MCKITLAFAWMKTNFAIIDSRIILGREMTFFQKNTCAGGRINLASNNKISAKLTGATGLATILLVSGGAHGFDGSSVLKRFETTLAEKGISLSYENAAFSGDDITLEKAVIEGKYDLGLDKTRIKDKFNINYSFSMGKVELGDISEETSDSPKIGFVEIDDISQRLTINMQVDGKPQSIPITFSVPHLSAADLVVDLKKETALSLPFSRIGRIETEPGKIESDFFSAQTGRQKSEGIEYKNGLFGSVKSYETDPIHIKFKPQQMGQKGQLDVRLGAVRGKDVNQNSLFSYSIGATHIDGIDINGVAEDDTKFDVSLDPVQISNYYSIDHLIEPKLPFIENDSFIIGEGGKVTINDMPIVSAGNFRYDFKYSKSSDVYDAKFDFGSFVVDLERLAAHPKADARFKAFVAEFGYPQLTINYDGLLAFDLANEILDVKNTKLTLKDGGAFSGAMKVHGYGRDFIKKSMESNQQQIEMFLAMLNDPKAAQRLQAQNTQAQLAMLAQLSLGDTKISVKNDSLANRIVGLQAKKSGQKPEEIIAVAPMMVAMSLAQFQIPDFANALSKAVENFFKNSGTITLSMQPDAPLGMMDFMTISEQFKKGQMTPAQLIDKYNIIVSQE